MGKRVLIMSTDQAHSLGDALDLTLGEEPRTVAEGLEALELDPNAESRKAWGNLRDYLRQIISEKANGGLDADEVLMFPGLEELFSLLRILDIWEEARCDVLIVDCAPTGETLSLLRYPERLSVLADRMIPTLRSVTKAFGGLITRKTTVPKPRDEVFTEFERVVKRLSRLQEILCDREQTSLRLVMTPERIVLDESRRSYSWLQVFEFGVDAVYINRIYPEEAMQGYFSGWLQMQEENLRLARESFFHQRIFTLPLLDHELRGQKALTEAAQQLYDGEDPARLFCTEPAFRMEDAQGTRKLIIPLPYMTPEDIRVSQEGGDLILKVRNETRRFHLPDRLNRRYVSGWSYENDTLCVRMDYD